MKLMTGWRPPTIVASGLPALLWLSVLTPAAQAANPPTPNPSASKADANAAYIPLGTSAFGPNGHGAYAWFVDAKNQQVVMCLVHNPQSEIECKRAPLPPVTPLPAPAP